MRTKQVLKGALVILFAVSTSVPQWTVYGESISSESESREVETTETTDAGNETNRVLHKQKQILKQRLRHLLLAQIKKRPLPQITNKQKKQQLQKCQTTNPLLLK